MSLDFKKMIEIVLRKKQELSPEEVRDLIDEKKRKIGAGYLTDQGALFLVAADLGISFDNETNDQTTIKDIFVGANDVTIIARVISVYPIRVYTKRDTNEEFQNRTISIYDKNSSIKVKLWDNHVNFPDEEKLRSGDLIKISHGYVKSGLDNKPIINLGMKGILEKLSDPNSDIPDLQSKIKTVEEINENENVGITGKIQGNPFITRFTNFRNEPSKALKFTLTNEQEDKTIRVIVWNIEEEKIPKVFANETKINLIGIRVKQGNPQYTSDQWELHGDEGTIIEVLSNEDLDKVFVFKIISNGNLNENSMNNNVLTVDKKGKLTSVVIDESLLNEEIKVGTIIEGIPNKIFGNVLFFNDDEAYIKTSNEDKSFPKLSKLETKIKDIQISDKPYITEAIVLQTPSKSDITTKSGENISLCETLIGDDTGEIRLIGWREQSEKVEKLNVGDRMRAIGLVSGMGKEGKLEVTLKKFSEIQKIE